MTSHGPAEPTEVLRVSRGARRAYGGRGGGGVVRQQGLGPLTSVAGLSTQAHVYRSPPS